MDFLLFTLMRLTLCLVLLFVLSFFCCHLTWPLVLIILACGYNRYKNDSPLTERIVGGNNSVIGEWPWQVCSHFDFFFLFFLFFFFFFFFSCQQKWFINFSLSLCSFFHYLFIYLSLHLSLYLSLHASNLTIYYLNLTAFYCP